MSTDQKTEYTLGEVIVLLKEMDRRNIDKHKQQELIQLQILEQTKKTNGRVSKLEVWRGFITGGMAIISILILPILLRAL